MSFNKINCPFSDIVLFFLQGKIGLFFHALAWWTQKHRTHTSIHSDPPCSLAGESKGYWWCRSYCTGTWPYMKMFWLSHVSFIYCVKAAAGEISCQSVQRKGKLREQAQLEKKKQKGLETSKTLLSPWSRVSWPTARNVKLFSKKHETKWKC